MKTRTLLSIDQMLQLEAHLAADPATAGQWMDRASRGIASWLLSRFSWRYTLILAGPGGNGGDGWLLARYLKRAGWNPLVAYLEPRHPLTLKQYEGARLECVRSIDLESWLKLANKPKIDLIVDGLLGIGAKGPLQPLLSQALEWSEELRAASHNNPQELLRVAIDCPTGWHSDPGRAFQADHTLSIHALKKELLTPSVRECSGQLHRIDIGIPDSGAIESGVTASKKAWIHLDEPVTALLPQTRRCIHKYQRGVVYIVASSPHYPGAGRLVEQGAWWLQPGMVYRDDPHPDDPRSVYLQPEQLLPPAQLREGSVLVIGPGLSRTPSSLLRLKNALYTASACHTIIVDGDALWHLAQDPSIRELLPPHRTLLTPHEGELDRLLESSGANPINCSIEEKIDLTLALAQKHQFYILFKGAVSYLCCPDGQILVEPFGGPHLAVGGSGDRLAGMLGSALSRGLDRLTGCALALRAHAT